MNLSTCTSNPNNGVPSGRELVADLGISFEKREQTIEERLEARRARVASARAAFSAPDWWTQWA